MRPYVSASGRTYRNFKKSSRSTGGGNCVEVGVNNDGTIALRDSKDPTGPVIELSPDAFCAFLNAVKHGAFHRI